MFWCNEPLSFEEKERAYTYTNGNGWNRIAPDTIKIRIATYRKPNEQNRQTDLRESQDTRYEQIARSILNRRTIAFTKIRAC